jgi:lysine-specific demethylase/histidyl-hydroxylase NO66
VCKEALKLADFGADEMMKRFMSERLPPAFDEEEKTLTNDNPGNGEVCAETLVRIAREGIARIVLEDGKCVLYHCADNNRDHLTEISPMEFEADDAPAIELLLRTAAPHWVKVADLPHPPADDVDDKIEIVKALYEEGIVGIMQPGWISDRVGGKQ